MALFVEKSALLVACVLVKHVQSCCLIFVNCPHEVEQKRTCSSSTLAARGSASDALTMMVERTMIFETVQLERRRHRSWSARRCRGEKRDSDERRKFPFTLDPINLASLNHCSLEEDK